MTQKVTIEQLTYDLAEHREDEFLQLINSCWREINEQPWTVENLLRNLDRKWDLSCYASSGDDIIGIQIGYLRNGAIAYNAPTYENQVLDLLADYSMEDEYVFSAMTAVSSDHRGDYTRTSSGLSVASGLFTRFLSNANQLGYKIVYGSVLTSNTASLKFISRFDAKIIGQRTLRSGDSNGNLEDKHHYLVMIPTKN